MISITSELYNTYSTTDVIEMQIDSNYGSLTFADGVMLDLFQLLRGTANVVHCVEDELQCASVLQHLPRDPRQVKQVLPLWRDVVDLFEERVP